GAKTGGDTLLLLWPAMRDSTQSPQQPGHWIRTVGRVSIQSRNAVSERCDTLHAELASGPPPRTVAAGCFGIPSGSVERGLELRRNETAPDPGTTRPGRRRCVRRRFINDRESVPVG